MKRIISLALVLALLTLIFLLASCKNDENEDNPHQNTTAAPTAEVGGNPDTQTDAYTTTGTPETAPDNLRTKTDSQSVTTAPATKTPEQPQQPEVSGGVTSKGYKIEVKDGVTYVGGILIANKSYALPESYGSGLTPDCLSAFYKLQSAAKADGLSIWVKSGYRSYYDQRYIYNGYVSEHGAESADTFSARAGHSEHQTGLAMDINSTDSSFAATPEGKWLAANCWKYGFIIRYPEGKSGVTGYMYEPWHIRYLGVETATAVYNSGLTLEEYLGITSRYS